MLTGEAEEGRQAQSAGQMNENEPAEVELADAGASETKSAQEPTVNTGVRPKPISRMRD